MAPEILRLAKQIMTNGGIVEECREVLDELPDYRDGFEGWSREKLNEVAAEAEGKYNRAVAELAALLGAPAEIPKPETVGHYFVREAETVTLHVVDVYFTFGELRVSFPYEDQMTALDDPRFDGAQWWTCPEPRKDGEK